MPTATTLRHEPSLKRGRVFFPAGAARCIVRHTAPWLVAGCSLLVIGCATQRLEHARSCFATGQFAAAQAELAKLPKGTADRVLFLMERGTAAQAAGDYHGSINDWQEAARLIEALDYLSVSRSSSSLVINDRVQAFRGAPFERTLLRTFTAKSYLALGLWEDAAVEARNVVASLQNLNGFPDDAYSRYVAAFCFEMIGAYDDAALEYRAAASLVPYLRISDRTGAIAPAVTNPPDSSFASVWPAPTNAAELVCFVLIGCASGDNEACACANHWGPDPFAEIYAENRYLGRSYCLANTLALRTATEARLTAIKAAKTAARVLLKDAIARQVSKEDQLLGSLAWLLLFSLETPDTRRWETLPQFLQVARVPCPADLKGYTIVFRGAGGQAIEQRVVTSPLTRHGRTIFSLCRAL